MVYGKGLAFLKQQQEQLGSFGDRLSKLWLKDGETARFWFLYTPDETPVPLVHIETKFSTKKNTQYNIDTMCARASLLDPIENCPKCVAGPEANFKGPYPRPVFAVWVQAISHPSLQPNKNWKSVLRKGSQEPRYMETVEAVWLFIPGRKTSEQLERALEGDPMDPEAEPLDILSCSWRLEVTGEKQQKVEKLSPEKITDVPDMVRDLRAALPDLDKIITDEYGKVPTMASVRAKADTVAGGAGAQAVNGAAGTVRVEPDVTEVDEDRPEIDF